MIRKGKEEEKKVSATKNERERERKKGNDVAVRCVAVR